MRGYDEQFKRGSNSVGRVTAFQAVGRGFESRLPLLDHPADVAQLVEHFLGKEEVTGSIPVISSGLRIPLIENEGKQFRNSSLKEFYECSSIGRVAVSKTVGWGFESLHSCT